MKKLIYLIVLTLILGLVLTGCEPLSNISQVPAIEQTKVKPTGNLAGAEEVAWNLSGDVMPDPPYGSGDIIGSDTASKLIVNQPNGAVEVTVTGVMNGLNPDTTYRVFLSNAYTAYIDTGWIVTGSWMLAFDSTLWPGGNPYLHDMVVTGDTATGGTPVGGPYVNSWDAGVSVIGDALTIVGIYKSGSIVYPYTFTANGTITSGGSMSGSWVDSIGDSGTWTGSAGYSGLFTATVPIFTFTTDEFGSGSWHINLRNNDFPGPGIYTLSVWINNGTILISDNFTVVVD